MTTAGQSLFQTREKELVNYLRRNASMTSLSAGLFMGLIGAAQWLPSHVYADGSFVVSTKTGNCRLFKSTSHSGSGTSGATDPFSTTGTETDGSTVTDNAGANQIIWTEQTMALEAVADSGAMLSELSGSSYARISVGLTNFPAASAIGGTTSGSQAVNGTAVTFAAASANWNPVVIAFYADAVTNGHYLDWFRLTSQMQINSGAQASFPIGNLTTGAD